MKTNGNGNGNLIKGLGERALLCGLSISMWGNRKQDKAISREAASSRGMGEKVGRYNKWLLIEDELGTPVREYDKIVSVRNRAGVVHRDITLPWMDDGTRINSAQNFNDWALAMRELKNEFESAVDYFVQEYPHLIARTESIMNAAAEKEGKPSMFNARNYPSQSQIQNKFQFSTSVMPLPEATDFRVKLSDNQIISIKSQIESQLNGVVMDCTQHLFERLSDVVRKVVHLGDPKSTIQKALVRDIESVCRIARKLNIAGDSYLDEFAKRIEQELSFEPMLLKTVPEERAVLAARADAILSDMSSFMGGGYDD